MISWVHPSHNPKGMSNGSAILHVSLQCPYTLYGPPLLASKLLIPTGWCGPPSSTWFVEPTWVLNSNGISIGWAGLTTVTDRPTDHASRSVTMGRIYLLRCGLTAAAAAAPVSQPASQPASQPTNQPTNQPINRCNFCQLGLLFTCKKLSQHINVNLLRYKNTSNILSLIANTRHRDAFPDLTEAGLVQLNCTDCSAGSSRHMGIFSTHSYKLLFH